MPTSASLTLLSPVWPAWALGERMPAGNQRNNLKRSKTSVPSKSRGAQAQVAQSASSVGRRDIIARTARTLGSAPPLGGQAAGQVVVRP
ncbi:hypothetical protein EI94DRAFT_1804360 [Lactarius quietus]|nr:hypothetical protein EI94DRAFT_1804360 [Lactarius quietus]